MNIIVTYNVKEEKHYVERSTVTILYIELCNQNNASRVHIIEMFISSHRWFEFTHIHKDLRGDLLIWAELNGYNREVHYYGL